MPRAEVQPSAQASDGERGETEWKFAICTPRGEELAI